MDFLLGLDMEFHLFDLDYIDTMKNVKLKMFWFCLLNFILIDDNELYRKFIKPQKSIRTQIYRYTGIQVFSLG